MSAELEVVLLRRQLHRDRLAAQSMISKLVYPNATDPNEALISGEGYTTSEAQAIIDVWSEFGPPEDVEKLRVVSVEGRMGSTTVRFERIK